MYTLLAIVLAVACGVGTFFLFSRIILPMPKNSSRTVLIVCPVAVCLLAMTLLIATATIPGKADRLMTDGIGQFEAYLNTVSPGYTDTELDPSDAVKLCEYTKAFKSYFENNPEMGLIVNLMGASVFVEYMTAFAQSIEDNIAEMEAAGKSLTMHNILDHIHLKAGDVISHTTCVMMWVIFGLFALACVIILIASYVTRKEGMKSGVTFGPAAENADGQ